MFLIHFTFFDKLIVIFSIVHEEIHCALNTAHIESLNHTLITCVLLRVFMHEIVRDVEGIRRTLKPLNLAIFTGGMEE